MNLLADAWFADVFSHLIECLSLLLIVSFCSAETFSDSVSLVYFTCCCLMYCLIHSTWERQGRRLGDLLGVTRGLWRPTWLGTLTPSGDPGSPQLPAGLGGLRWYGEMCPQAALPLCAQQAWQEGGAGG